MLYNMFISYRGGLSVSETIFATGSGFFLPVAKLQCGARIRTVAQGILDVRHGEAVARGFAGQGRSSEAHRCEVQGVEVT